ncbi:MAG: hypothetical protein KR126chlam6_01184 [Candidatus Anoxychlamydiales bacterium]|nr:hypothetical protein [Candidatus Anoxychlamydiales bacterium]
MAVSGDPVISTPIEGALPNGIIHAVIVPESHNSVLHAVIKDVGETLKTVIVEGYSYEAKSLGEIEKVETPDRYTALMSALPSEITEDLKTLPAKDLKSLEADLNKSLAQIEKEFATSIKELNDKIATLDKKDSFEQKDFDEIDGLLKEIKKLKKELSKTQLEATSSKIKKVAKNIVTFAIYSGDATSKTEHSEKFKKLYEKYSTIKRTAEAKLANHSNQFKEKLSESESKYQTLKDEFQAIKEEDAKGSIAFEPEKHYSFTNSFLGLFLNPQENAGVYPRKRKPEPTPTPKSTTLSTKQVTIAPKPALNFSKLRSQLEKAEGIKAKIAANNKKIDELEKKIDLIEAKKDSIESAISAFNELKSQFEEKNNLLELEKQKIFNSTKVLEADIKALKQEICNFLHKKIDEKPSNKEILFDKAFLKGVLEDSIFSDDEELNKIFNEIGLFEILKNEVKDLESEELEDQKGNEVIKKTIAGVDHYYIKKNYLDQINAAFKNTDSVLADNVQALNIKINHLNDRLIPGLLDKIADLEGEIDQLAIKNIALGEEKPFKVVNNAPAYETYSATAEEKTEFNNLNDATISKTTQFVKLTRKTTQFLSSLILNYKKHSFPAANFITSIKGKLSDLEIAPNAKVLDAFENAYNS